MKHKAGIFFLIAISTLPAVLLFCWLSVQKHQIKKQFKHRLSVGIRTDELVLMKFSKSDSANVLHWEHANEFEYKNSMYDVVNRSSTNDSIFLTCWLDNEESKLNTDLKVLIYNHFDTNQTTKETKNQFLSFFKNLYHCKINRTNYFSEQSNFSSCQPKTWYTNPYLSVALPPPKCI